MLKYKDEKVGIQYNILFWNLLVTIEAEALNFFVNTFLPVCMKKCLKKKSVVSTKSFLSYSSCMLVSMPRKYLNFHSVI